jgi:hypothetical protein
MEKNQLAEEMRKEQEYKRWREINERANEYLDPNRKLREELTGEGYRIPTLTERIEQLEKKINHLERLIGVR